MTPQRAVLARVPDRGDVIWIDHNPQAGREMQDHYLCGALNGSVPSQGGLVAGCAMTSAACNRGSSLAVDLGPRLQRPQAHSEVLCHQSKSFDWKARGARPHPPGRLDADKLEQVLEIVGQLQGFLP